MPQPQVEPPALPLEETRPRLRSWLTRALIALLSLGAIIAYFALTPRSQPCWPKPEGYVPAELLTRREELPAPPQLSAPLTILLGGDAMIGRGVARSLKRSPRYEPLRGLSAPRPVDLVHFNLESAVSGPHPEWPWKAYRFRLEPQLLKRALRLSGAGLGQAKLALSLANNHSLDFGREGLKETLSALNSLGLSAAGAGLNAEGAWSPAKLIIKGQRVGLLSVTDHCGCLDMCGWLATEERAGLAYAYLSGGEWGPLLEATRRLRSRSELVIVSLHSGPNYLDSVPSWQVALGRSLVDAGATIVLMHSAHHVLPFERYGEGLIFYALGDLVNDYSVNERYRNDLGATALIHVKPGASPELELRPHQLKRRAHHALPLSSPDAQLTLKRLQASVD